ncbi:hypothetical protein PVBG_06155 [Plasmodium vivax Brazil I]|uniref:Uncharacterized protein n=1 Tax=Plasmodium vivax (strain Brazil I) TaxID=1033975 RepID=A0A0J9T051_PLAV1|nr:hypothetical protein PVBG_06155 [Plasmodium vivax Brazil I]
MSELKENSKFDFFNFIYNGYENDRPTKEDPNLGYILQTDDAYLRNVALYLRIYYEIAGLQYFNKKIDSKDLCNHLNIWLNEKKVLYTSGGSCLIKNNLWEKYIENIIWDKLRAIQLTPGNIGNSYNKGFDWCPRDKSINNKKISHHLMLKIAQIVLQLHVPGLHLLRFTPIGSLLNRITGKKKRPWENNMNGLPRNFSENYFNSESPNNQERMNNLFYPSMRN